MNRVLTSLLALTSASISADWPQHLGPDRNGTTAEIVQLDLEAITKNGLTESWRLPIGSGFSSPIIKNNTVYLFHRKADLATVSALQLSDGKQIWESSYPTSYQDDFGFDDGPRATPACSDQHLFTFGAEGILRCIQLSDGAEIWKRDLAAELDAGKGFFGRACSPLLVDDKVILHCGAPTAGIAAFDQTSGETIWTATNHEAGYSAPILVERDGSPLLVSLTRSGIVVINPKNGTVLDEKPFRSSNNASANAATPIQIGDANLLFTAAYEVGASSFALDQTGTLQQNWHLNDTLDAHYSTPLYTGEFIIGFHGRQETGQELRAISPDLGELLWVEPNLGNGTPILAGTLLLILNDDGELILGTPSQDAFTLHLREQILKRGHRSLPALSHGILVARDAENLVCIPLQP